MSTLINFTKQREMLKEWLSFLMDLVKISTLFSGPLGLFLLGSYLSSTGSPMLTPDSSTVLTLLLVVAGYIFMIFFLGVFVYSPIYTWHVNGRTRSFIKTRSSMIESHIGKLLRTYPGKLGYKPKNNDFIIFHGASLFLFIDLAIGVLLEFSIKTWAISLLLFVSVGILTSIIRYKHWKIIPKH